MYNFWLLSKKWEIQGFSALVPGFNLSVYWQGSRDTKPTDGDENSTNTVILFTLSYENIDLKGALFD